MQRDKRVYVIGEDVGVYGGAFKVTQGFQDEFGPWRVIDAPLSETAIVGSCTGAAMMGLRPVAEMQFADFVSDRKSTRLNSSHANISYAVFCLKKKKHNMLLVSSH